MRPAAKAGLVAIGYLAALAVAWVVVTISAALSSNPDRQASGGMSAFGDSLLFLGTFGVAALPATGAALFFLKSRRAFWIILSAGSLGLAFTSLVALLMYFAPTAVESHGLLHSGSPLAVLRILVAPLFAMFFLLAGLFAPSRSARMCLVAAGVTEMAAFASIAFTWVRPLLHH